MKTAESLGSRLISRHFARGLPRLAPLACFLAAAACGGKAAEAPPPPVPLSEERAAHLIAGVLENSGTKPARGMSVPLEGGASLDVDVADASGEFGVAYVTKTERARLGKALPAVEKSDNAPLTVIRGSEGQPVLVLDADNYTYDDARGVAHEEPTAIAEGKLRRDVRDFLVHVAKKP